MTGYCGWNLFDKVSIITKENTYRGITQGYVVDSNNKKSLQSAIKWGQETKCKFDANGDVLLDEKGHTVYEITDPEIVETDNEGFKVSLYDCAGASSQGGKLSFWNCKIEKDGREYIVGISTDLLLDLLKQSTFVNGTCTEEVIFARNDGGLGLLTKTMPEYKQAITDMQLRKELKQKKTLKWQVGYEYSTLCKTDIYLGAVYEPIIIDSGILDYYNYESGLPDDIATKMHKLRAIGKTTYYYEFDIDIKRKTHLVVDKYTFEKYVGAVEDKTLQDYLNYCIETFDANAKKASKATEKDSYYGRKIFRECGVAYEYSNKDTLSKLPARKQGEIKLETPGSYDFQVGWLYKHIRESYEKMLKNKHAYISVYDLNILLRSIDGKIDYSMLKLFDTVFDRYEMHVEEKDSNLFKIKHDGVIEYFLDKKLAKQRIIELLSK